MFQRVELGTFDNRLKLCIIYQNLLLIQLLEFEYIKSLLRQVQTSGKDLSKNRIVCSCPYVSAEW